MAKLCNIWAWWDYNRMNTEFSKYEIKQGRITNGHTPLHWVDILDAVQEDCDECRKDFDFELGKLYTCVKGDKDAID